MVVLVANDAPVLLLAHYVDQGVARTRGCCDDVDFFFEVFTEALREQQ